MRERIEWMDKAKGIGMILVILAHAVIPEKLGHYIYTFHMPLFFFLAGYLYMYGKYTGIKSFFEKKVNSLIIPYLWFAGINYMFWLMVKYFLIKNEIPFYKPILGTIFGLRLLDWSPQNGPLWFVLCLIMTELIFYNIALVCRNSYPKIIGILGIFAVVGFCYNYFIKIKLPFSIDVALVAVVFYGIGYIFKEKKLIEKVLLNNKILVLCLIILSFITGMMNRHVDMFWGVYANPILFYISAFSGLLYVIVITMKLPKMDLVTYIGKNSLIFLALHHFMVFGIFNIILMKIGIKIESLQGNLLVGLLYTIGAIGILVPVSMFINKYTPFVLGKRNKIQIQTTGVK